MIKPAVSPPYSSAKIVPLFTLNKIVTIHYFELSGHFEGPMESHDFWEFVYVDKGRIQHTLGNEGDVRLAQGEYVIIRPNTPHGLRSCEGTNPNVFIISFVCHSKAMHVFRNHRGALPARLRHCIADIVSEARQTYYLPHNDPGMLELLSRENALPGGQQLIQLYLEQLLISLYRTLREVPAPLPDSALMPTMTKNAHVNSMLAYIRENVYRPLAPAEVCAHEGYSAGHLSTLFHRHCACSIARYINLTKIDEAKALIRRGVYSLTDIALMLGYSDPHYFSRLFKQITGMSPSEYRKSVQL